MKWIEPVYKMLIKKMFFCSPVPTIRWTRDNKEEVQYLLANHGKVLHFSDLREEDAGEYHCQATNEGGISRRHTFTVEVESKNYLDIQKTLFLKYAYKLIKNIYFCFETQKNI